MFYFKITVRSKNGDGPRKSREVYREALNVDDIGEAVASKLRHPLTTSVSVTRISQAAFIRATRPGA
jgi:hypothetical protein